MKKICKQCEKEFVLTQDEIAFYQSKNLHIPKRCETCRRENRAGGKTEERMQLAGKGRPQAVKEPESGKPDGELSGNGYENVVRPNQVVRAYHSKEHGRKTPWAVIAAVLILLAVVVIGSRLGFWSDQDGGTAQNQAVQPLTSETSDVLETEDSKSTLDITDVEKPSDDVLLNDGAQETKAAVVQRSETESGADADQDVAAEVTPGAEAAVEEAPVSETAAPVVTYTYNFRKAEYLQEHFAKHGEEFGYASAEEYLAGANRVIASPEALHKLEAEDGDAVYYLESTNEFVIVSTDGFLRTYFKPEDGKAYFERQ